MLFRGPQTIRFTEISYMNVSLTHDLKNFVRKKVQSGEFPSEEAVVEAALKSLQDQEAPAALDNLIDHEFVEFCGREGDDTVTLDEVLKATSTIPGSMAQAIIEEERADRF
jgi:putative addiction module CopG family antidote